VPEIPEPGCAQIRLPSVAERPGRGVDSESVARGPSHWPVTPDRGRSRKLPGDEIAERSGDGLIPVPGGVLVAQRRCGRRVAHAVHQLPGAGAGRGRQGVGRSWPGAPPAWPPRSPPWPPAAPAEAGTARAGATPSRASSFRRRSRPGTLVAVPATAFPTPGCACASRSGLKHAAAPRRCSAHRVRPDRLHRPRSRPVFGPPLRQLASDPFHPVQGGCEVVGGQLANSAKRPPNAWPGAAVRDSWADLQGDFSSA
jgi:hypothetical protein